MHPTLASALLANSIWVASLKLLRLVVFGSLAGLAFAVLALLVIWWCEWRSNNVW